MISQAIDNDSTRIGKSRQVMGKNVETMIPTSLIEKHFFLLNRYAKVWLMGTDVQESLAPGTYRVTGVISSNRGLFLTLNHQYKIRAEQFREYSNSHSE